MILISHRGNIDGKNLDFENKPEYITRALYKNFQVEIDLWCQGEYIFLGHDFPQYKIDISFLRQQNLWIHCKNIEALIYCKENSIKNNFFWHQNDDITLTSNHFFWTFPGKILCRYSIAVMPELKEFKNIETAYGICSDKIMDYR